jgi:hypothetical protein
MSPIKIPGVVVVVDVASVSPEVLELDETVVWDVM